MPGTLYLVLVFIIGVPVVHIVVIGVLFGALAAWRKTLRVGMVAHAWQDIWGGWLIHVIK
jgi:hypothetical protein